MIIFQEDKKSKFSCGINDDGDLFLGDDKSGYNLPDTPENRQKIFKDFDAHVKPMQDFSMHVGSVILDKLDALVNEHVEQYMTDWTDVFREQVERCDKSGSFIVMLRDMGVDVVFLRGQQVNYSNLQWGKACLEQDRSKLYMLYDDGVLKSVHRNVATKILKETIKELPSNYLEACETASHKMMECPKLEDWKKESGYNKKQKKQAAKGFVR